MLGGFGEWSTAVFRHPPYAWQEALGAEDAPTHRLVSVCTGFGKTQGTLGAWLYHRIVRGDERWPRRLVWALPMRTLVEQVEGSVRAALDAAGLLWAGEGAHGAKVGLHTLMGGADAGEWHLHPEAPAVIIGTQDMLLSRALNRGYGAARARWPVDFGLLSQDCLWVLDEVQLMGVGLATALQLAAFRAEEEQLRPNYTWAMSATLPASWARKSPDTVALAEAMQPTTLGADDKAAPLWTDARKPTRLQLPGAPGEQAAEVLAAQGALPPHSQTLVVCNTVERAIQLFAAIDSARSPIGPKVVLLHSRFRGADRRSWASMLVSRPPAEGRILVSTQVVEAGVDLSADRLFTEICPWPSLIQRAGRLARRGGSGAAVVWALDIERSAGPYTTDELKATLDALRALDDLSPRAIATFEADHPELLAALYPYEPESLLLREELAELFDTTADLSGGDVDVSRFIREGEDRDLLVTWGPLLDPPKGGGPPRPPADTRPGRDGLCAVPAGAVRDWLCGKATKASQPQRLKVPDSAFVWDFLDGAWRTLRRPDLRPGALVYVDAKVGGYRQAVGFDPGSAQPVVPSGSLVADLQERTDSAADNEALSIAGYQTIAFHGAAVAIEVRAIAESLSLHSGDASALDVAARWHDVGKAHPAFQGAIVGSVDAPRPASTALAKAPDSAWRPTRALYRVAEGGAGPAGPRPGFRHELASTLALFDVLNRWAPAGHPSRFGDWADAVGGEGPRGPATGSEAGELEREVLALDGPTFDLVAYLVCAHHGKLRARLHASPADQDARLANGGLPIRGIYEGECLPAMQLAMASGGVAMLPQSTLSLDPSQLGLSPRTGRSWTERVDSLRRTRGPFALAFLEAVLRAADVRASRDKTLQDPAFAVVASPPPNPAGEVFR